MSPLPGGYIAPAQLVKDLSGDNYSSLSKGGIILSSFAPTIDNVGDDELDLNFISSGAGGSILIYLDFNRHTSSVLGARRFMNIATFAFVQFDQAYDINERQAPILTNLDDLRYRCRRLPSADPLDGSTFMQFTPINVWSDWRGGNPGAPLQQDSNFYSFSSGQFGTKTGRFQYQYEQPDGSGTIIEDRVIRLTLSKV